MIRDAIETILTGSDLGEVRAAEVMEEIMDGGHSPALVSAYLVALRAKGESISELVGSAKVMRRKSPGVDLDDLFTVDMCGTGGDLKGTFNISTTASFVVAAVGVPVAKHGNRAVSSRSGSADLLEALGADIRLSHEQVSRCVRQVGIGFFFAPSFHPAMRNVAPVRKALGLRTIFNVLGPLTNPAGVRAQLLGVYAPELVLPLAKVLRALGADRACVVHGEGGWDEATTIGRNRLALLRDGEVVPLLLEPETYGFPRAEPGDLTGGTPQENAVITRAVLASESGPRLDTTLLNAGLALLVAGRAKDPGHGISLARAAVRSGAAHRCLDNFIAVTRALGGGGL